MSVILDELEKESINLIREVITTNSPDGIFCFYSIGKDSSVLLKLIEKAFYPEKIKIPFLHIDTGYKFKEMYEFRDRIAQKIDLKIYKHPALLNPYTDGSKYTDIMKTEALKNAINEFGIKIAFGGSRREEEKSRAKERMVSIRDKNCKWNPRNQNCEVNYLWNTYYTDDTTLRVFPLSNWTEIDIWEYIKRENIDIVPIYYSHIRNVEKRNGQLFATEDDNRGEKKRVRFRTLGCYPLSAAIESEANCIDDIIRELKTTRYTERIGRVIDFDQEGSMEIKKCEGYF